MSGPQKICPGCDKEIHAAYIKCPHCNQEFARKTPMKTDSNSRSTDYRTETDIEEDALRACLPDNVYLVSIQRLVNVPQSQSKVYFLRVNNDHVVTRYSAKAVMHDAWGHYHGKKHLLKKS